MRRRSNALYGLLVALVLCWGTACSDDDNDNGSQDSNHASSSTGDSAAADGADSESDTVLGAAASPYEDVDCAGRGADPLNCEYEICFHQQMYDQLVARCGAGCAAERQCYAALAACMKSVCPVHTAVPEDKSAAGIYTCKNTFDEDCMAPLL